MTEHEKVEKLEQRIGLLEKLLSQSLDYLGLVTALSDDEFNRTVIQQFVERGRLVTKNSPIV